MLHKVKFFGFFQGRIRNQDGQGLTEYLILLLLIAVISIAAAKSLGSTVKNKIELAKRHINKELQLGD